MASYNELNALIDAYINRNGVQAITGQILNGVLKAMVEQLGRGYTIMGAATPTTEPGTPDAPECYFASETGTYTDFDGLQVVPGELALLCYTPTDGWTKNTIYEGFQTVQATIDGNVGTPSVGVSYANGVLSFDFRNLKGSTGDPAGFGTVAATVDENIGTPGVSVQTSGPDTAKNLTFAFTNLKGETGVTSVVATVDNTTGTPACTVSLVGQQLTLAFTGLKGAQGNTGVSADYPIAIINNLTTDDPASALSAAQGVVLDGKVSQLEAEVNHFDSTDLIAGGFYNLQNKSVGDSISSKTPTAHGGAYKTLLIPVVKGQVYVLSTNGNAVARAYAVTNASLVITAITPTDSVTNQSITIPEDGYLFINAYNDYSVFSLSVQTKIALNALNEEAISLNTRVTNAENSVSTLSNNLQAVDRSVDDLEENTRIVYVQKSPGTNIVDDNTLTLKALIKNDGTLKTGLTENYGCSDYIPVNGRNIIARGYNASLYPPITVYDNNKAILRTITGASPQQYTYQAGDAYIRINFYITSSIPPKANYGSTLQDYVKYNPIDGYLSEVKSLIPSYDSNDKTLSLSANPIETIRFDVGLCPVIKEWGIIGDSLISGMFSCYNGQQSASLTDYYYSWGQVLCRLSGATGTNFSYGGQTAKGWLNETGERGWGSPGVGCQANPKQCYMLALGVNDKNNSTLYADGVGTLAEDVDLNDYTNNNEDSFIGCYAGIVQRLKSIQPKTIIFAVTIPQTTPYNDAIRAVASAFDNVFLIDLNLYGPNFSSTAFQQKYYMGNHLNSMGYVYVAYLMANYIDWIIRNNPNAFGPTCLIGTSYTPTPV